MNGANERPLSDLPPTEQTERAEELLSEWGAGQMTVAEENGLFSVSYVHDRISYTGSGTTLLHALIEARTDNVIANHYYYGDSTLPTLTQAQMDEIRTGAYQHALGETPGGTYHGEYNGR